MFLSVLVPVYNGAQYLERCLDELVSTLVAEPFEWEVIVCEDGSTDGTKQLIGKLKGRYPQVKFLQSDARLGRGGALRRAAEAASGEHMVYLDVDMATDIRHLDEIVEHVSNGSDVVTGSRYRAGARANRTVKRLAMSMVYNGMVRTMLGSQLKDHQCGFKAFKRSALDQILPQVRSNHWFWDTEVLVRAQAMGLIVDEVPVTWNESEEGTTVHLRKDVPYFISEVLRLRKELRSRHTH